MAIFGVIKSIMACIFRLTLIPQKLSCCQPEHILVWIQFHVIRSKGVKGLLEVTQVVTLPCAFYQHVIHINLHIPPNLMCEHFIHQSLVCGSHVLKSERHQFVAEESLAGDK